MDAQRVSQLIEQIYGAGMGQISWSVVLAEMARTSGDSQAIVYERDFSGGPPNVLGSYNIDPEYGARYVAHYGLIDVWHRCLMARPSFEPAPTDALIDRRELHATEFYNDFLRPLDVERGIGALAHRGANSVTLFAMQRSRRRGRFSERDQKLMTLLFPHIRRSLELHHALRRAQLAAGIPPTENVQMQLGLIVLSGSGRVVFANRAAFDVLLRLGITLAAGRLSASGPQGDRIVEAIENAAAASEEELRRRALYMTVSLDERTAIDLAAAAQDEQVASRGETGIAVTLRLRTSPDMAARLQSGFRLTPSEATLALGLFRGETLADIARLRGTSVNTVRVQLRSTFDKTGCRRQIELVRLVQALSAC